MNSGSLRPRVVLVGGFLGSGKTTLIFSAARELERRALRSAVIFNDQGKELVDTRYADLSDLRSGEVVGGRFCCKLSDLVNTMEEMRAYSPGVIFASPSAAAPISRQPYYGRFRKTANTFASLR